ncbi:Predicted N-acetyltransferase [Phaffia rhodozyma]|uniref:Predicted N-acetyltransferase n=1 Tax=Phaffia rhodozyma TaxID=264483 RepID=A0A0F7SKX9_PHARH|nr:Predicted N-acetyltransferase [Phaffia rhodozyma]
MSAATSSTTTADPSSMDTKSTVSAPISLDSKKTIKPHPRVTLSSFTPNNVGTLRKLNSAILPVAYSNKYYTEILDASLEEFNKLVYYADVPVGSISSRFESFPPSTTTTSSSATSATSSSSSTSDLHILTLAVLPAYRSQGLGALLLKHVLDRAQALTSPDGQKIGSVFVYCQVGNEIARNFYVKNEFEVVDTIANYYSARIEPRDAFLLRYRL